MQYGVFTYNYSNNIGDEVQSIAAERFLPRTDRLIERDRFQWYRNEPETLLICNGWFTRQSCWPPPPSIKPVFVSFYAHRPADLIKKEHAAYFNQNGPIGCRSRATVEEFKRIGVDAYFSGCLTLTLPKTGRPRTNRTYALDVEPDLYAQVVPAHVRGEAKVLSNAFPRVEDGRVKTGGWNAAHFTVRVLNKVDPERKVFRGARMKFEQHKHLLRMRLAHERLQTLSEAKLVITSRLHCAMPCLAMGTPVVLLRRGVEQDPRFSGLWELVRHASDSGAVPIDWDNPGPNPDDYLQYANALARRCQDAVAQFAARVQPGNSPAPAHVVQQQTVPVQPGGLAGVR